MAATCLWFDTRTPAAIIAVCLGGRLRSSPSRRAGVAQLVERNLAKVEVASSRLVSRSTHQPAEFHWGLQLSETGPCGPVSLSRCGTSCRRCPAAIERGRVRPVRANSTPNFGFLYSGDVSIMLPLTAPGRFSTTGADREWPHRPLNDGLRRCTAASTPSRKSCESTSRACCDTLAAKVSARLPSNARRMPALAA